VISRKILITVSILDRLDRKWVQISDSGEKFFFFDSVYKLFQFKLESFFFPHFIF
jgi:hypothetical protein